MQPNTVITVLINGCKVEYPAGRAADVAEQLRKAASDAQMLAGSTPQRETPLVRAARWH
jgi:hypothetical protein